MLIKLALAALLLQSAAMDYHPRHIGARKAFLNTCESLGWLVSYDDITRDATLGFRMFEPNGYTRERWIAEVDAAANAVHAETGQVIDAIVTEGDALAVRDEYDAMCSDLARARPGDLQRQNSTFQISTRRWLAVLEQNRRAVW